jgi:hypothetical protein
MPSRTATGYESSGVSQVELGTGADGPAYVRRCSQHVSESRRHEVQRLCGLDRRNPEARTEPATASVGVNNFSLRRRWFVGDAEIGDQRR